MEKLENCPFCGESENLKPRLLPTTKGETWKTITCLVCGAQGPISKDGIEANSLWQKRHLTRQCSGREIAEAFCLDCGFDYGSSNCQGCEHYSRR